MTDWANTQFPGEIRRRTAAQNVQLPKPQPFCAPVLITDCVSPLAGETILSLLLKRMTQKDRDEAGTD